MLGERLGVRDIRLLCHACVGHDGDTVKEQLYLLFSDPDDRVGYNALWVFTHLTRCDRLWVLPMRSRLIDMLLIEKHDGKRRLLLTLLEQLPTHTEDFRTDFFDYCLSKINSTEPYAIRALCMKQAFAQCRLYPDLLFEFENELEIMKYGALPPGLKSARRNIVKEIAKIKK